MTSRVTERAEPWQLQYYDPPTRDVIDRAKQFSHCDAASINAFPARVAFGSRAKEYIDEAIEERRSCGLAISDGKLRADMMLITTNWCSGWWPNNESGITRLVSAAFLRVVYLSGAYFKLWEDLGNWRSALRKKARTFVTQRYQWDPENHRERNVEIAKNLLGNGGLFLRDGTDDEVRQTSRFHSV